MLPVALNNALFEHDSQQRFVLVGGTGLGLAASLYYFLQKCFEIRDVLFVVCDEAFVSDDFDEVAKCPHAVDYLLVRVLAGTRLRGTIDLRCICGLGVKWLLTDEDLFENSLDVVILNQTPEDLSAVHREESL